jgi:hypothetical protein
MELEIPFYRHPKSSSLTHREKLLTSRTSVTFSIKPSTKLAMNSEGKRAKENNVNKAIKELK